VNAEQRAKTPSPRTGLLATLRAPLRGRGSGVHSLRLLGLLALALAACAPSAASAATTHKFEKTFGTLANPQGIAIDQSTGDLYVADTGNHQIQKFDAEGNHLLSFGSAGSAPGHFESPTFLAVDNAPGGEGDLYVADTADKLITKLDPAGNPIATWGNNGAGGTANGQLAGKTQAEPFGQLGQLAGIAVDSAGTLEVLENFEGGALKGQLMRFGRNANFVGELTLARETEPRGLAVDSAGNIFKVNGARSVEEFTASGTRIGTVTRGSNAFTDPEASAIAVDTASGDLYMATRQKTLNHYAFNPSGEVIEASGPPCKVEPNVGCNPTDSLLTGFVASGLAINPTSADAYLSNPELGKVDLYEGITLPDVFASQASEIKATSAILNGEVGTAGTSGETALTACRFEYVSQAAFQTSGFSDLSSGGEVQCEPPVPNNGTLHPLSAEIEGLTPGATYRFRLVAANQNGSSEVEGPPFETLPPPSIDEALATEITAHSAKLIAKINPRGFQSKYRFEYGPCEIATTCYGGPYAESIPVPDEGIGNSGSDVSVSEVIEGLSANTTYHWRVVASNENGIKTGSDHTFIFDTEGFGGCPNEALRTENGSLALSDCRAYETVTPPFKNGALVGAVSFVGGVPGVSATGGRVIAKVLQCFAGAGSCNAQHQDGIGSPYAFTRTTAGWAATSLAPPASLFPRNTPWEYDATSGSALFSMSTPPFREDDLYKREADGTFTDIGPVTPPALGPLGPEGGNLTQESQAQTADLSHVVFGSTRYPGRLVEYVGTGNTEPFPVGVGGEEQGATDLLSGCGRGINLGGADGLLSSALSADGRTVYFTAIGEKGGNANNSCRPGLPAPLRNVLYARIDGERESAHTVAISDPEPSECGQGGAANEKSCREAPLADGEFQAGSEDGTVAYFLSTRQLTDEASEDPNPKDTAEQLCRATIGPGGCNLYRYDFNAPAGHHLTAVSAGDTSGLGPRVAGVMAISPDGSTVYFVARGVLAGANPEGKSPLPGQNNLYVYRRDTGHPTFIATLPESDNETWRIAGGGYANVTPDGRVLVFRSRALLTPDDTSQSGALQIFRYDAGAEALNRVTIGQRGFNDNGNRSAPAPCTLNGCSEDALIIQSGGFHRSDPTMSDDGSRVFFQSPVALTPGALDDRQIGVVGLEASPVYAQNVYEWEAPGAGSCDQASGCVFLISDGSDTAANAGSDGLCPLSATCLLGVDASGENAFFTTVNQLAPADSDTELDYYDARVDGGFPATTGITPCQSSDTCHGPGTQEGVGPSPSTPGFSGPEEGPKHPAKAKKAHHKNKKNKNKKKHAKKKAHERAASANRRASR
jgi:hypothetical protein